MDEALREEGFDEHGSHAIFVRWQRELVEGLGGILLEAERRSGSGSRPPARGSKRRHAGFVTTSSGARKFC